MMTFDEVTPDTRIVCHSRGEIRGTVLAKWLPTPEAADPNPLVLIDFDGGGQGLNYPAQLSAIDEPAPAPRLQATGTAGEWCFWRGGVEYLVRNYSDNSRGLWRVHRADAKHGRGILPDPAPTRRAAVDQALAQIGG